MYDEHLIVVPGLKEADSEFFLYILWGSFLQGFTVGAADPSSKFSDKSKVLQGYYKMINFQIFAFFPLLC